MKPRSVALRQSETGRAKATSRRGRLGARRGTAVRSRSPGALSERPFVHDAQEGWVAMARGSVWAVLSRPPRDIECSVYEGLEDFTWGSTCGDGPGRVGTRRPGQGRCREKPQSAAAPMPSSAFSGGPARAPVLWASIPAAGPAPPGNDVAAVVAHRGLAKPRAARLCTGHHVSPSSQSAIAE